MAEGQSGGAEGPSNSTVVRSAEEKTAEYAVFALVPVFCIMGLIGILICNILKKKGYNCTAEKEGVHEESATPQKEGEKNGEMRSLVFFEGECLAQIFVNHTHTHIKRAKKPRFCSCHHQTQ